MRAEEYGILLARETTHWWYRTLHARVVEVLRSGARSGDLLLDAGCGTGGSLLRAGAAVPGLRSLGVDLAPEALEACRARGVGPLVRSGVERLPLRDASVDWVLSLDVLYHANVTDDRAALVEFARVTRPGGRLILNLPAFRWLAGRHDEAVQGVRRYTPRQVCLLLDRAGWSPVRVTCWNAVLLPWVWVVRRLRRGAGSDLPLGGRWADAFLAPLLGLERYCTRFITLPLGSSVFAIAVRR
ncbi:MAG: class I SAM-dependent methyltransferase [Planctomycetes bacterium]|nr:class I SAM-dependent methyltransferase [Planctomycetota bacterium]